MTRDEFGDAKAGDSKPKHRLCLPTRNSAFREGIALHDEIIVPKAICEESWTKDSNMNIGIDINLAINKVSAKTWSEMLLD